MLLVAGEQEAHGDAPLLVDVHLASGLADHDGTEQPRPRHPGRVVEGNDGNITAHAFETVAVKGQAATLVRDLTPTLGQAVREDGVEADAVGRGELETGEDELPLGRRMPIYPGVPDQHKTAPVGEAAHHALPRPALGGKLVGEDAAAPELCEVGSPGAGAGRVVGVVDEAVGQGIAGLALVEGGGLGDIAPADCLAVEAAPRDSTRRQGSPGLPGVDGVTGLGGIGALEADGAEGVGDIEARRIGEDERVNGVAVLPAAAKMPGDALLGPQPGEESGVALTGLHREGTRRIAALEAVEGKPEGGGKDAIGLPMLVEDLLGDLHDGEFAKDPPGLAVGENAQGVLEVQFEDRGGAIRQEPLDTRDDAAHPSVAALVVTDGKPHRQTLDILQREAVVIAKTLHPVAQQAADSLLALRAVGDQAPYSLWRAGRKDNLEEAHGLGECRKCAAHGGMKTGFGDHGSTASPEPALRPARQASSPCRTMAVQNYT